MSEVPLYVLGVQGFTAAEREENTFKGFEDLCLKHGSRECQHLSSRLSYLCGIGPTAVRVLACTRFLLRIATGLLPGYLTNKKPPPPRTLQ